MRKLPSDLQILRFIYKEYFKVYSLFSREDKNRQVKVFVPINIKSIASKLKTDEDIIFGRLYYHLENKYSYKREDGSQVSFFAKDIGKERHCINFPYMASMLANLEVENSKFKTSIIIAVVSLIISAISIAISFLL